MRKSIFDYALLPSPLNIDEWNISSEILAKGKPSSNFFVNNRAAATIIF